jgi:hypothetical protein
MSLIRAKNQSMPPAAEAVPHTSGRRQFLKTMTLMLLVPLLAIACEQKQAGNRQGADNMHVSQKEAISQRTVPSLDTQIPADIQTATFAMG